MTTDDLFANAKRTQSEGAPVKDKISLASHRLAIELTENDLLPTRYRKSADSAQQERKSKETSKVEKRFKANVQSCRELIETMLNNLESEQAWRFINLVPRVDVGLTKVTDNANFCDFMEYLILRRDKEQCNADELGGLAHLLTAFQHEVEERIPRTQEGETTEPES